MTVRPGHLVPLRGGAPTDLVRRALEVSAAGGVPLIGDDRWSESYWRSVRDRSTASGPQPGQGWATLTSGTTGEPRIVLRTAASWADSFPAVGALLDLGPDDVLALSSPPASSLSLFSVAHAATVGCSLALPTTHALTPDDARDATRFHGTPNGLRALLDGEVPPRLRVALIGGASLDPGLRARAEDLGIRVVSYYGAAELSFVAVDDGADPDRPGLRAFPGVELEVRDDDVLWVRSPFVATGYLGGSGPLRRDGDWSSVGDRARIDDGIVTLLGRSDDAILTAAATVIPADVEEALRRLDEVDDAVVLGLPNAGVGSLVTAVLELHPGARPTRAMLRDALAPLLPPTHRPRRWFVVDELPRTVTGKAARAELADRLAAGTVASLD